MFCSHPHGLKKIHEKLLRVEDVLSNLDESWRLSTLPIDTCVSYLLIYWSMRGLIFIKNLFDS